MTYAHMYTYTHRNYITRTTSRPTGHIKDRHIEIEVEYKMISNRFCAPIQLFNRHTSHTEHLSLEALSLHFFSLVYCRKKIFIIMCPLEMCVCVFCSSAWLNLSQPFVAHQISNELYKKVSFFGIRFFSDRHNIRILAWRTTILNYTVK